MKRAAADAADVEWNGDGRGGQKRFSLSSAIPREETGLAAGGLVPSAGGGSAFCTPSSSTSSCKRRAGRFEGTKWQDESKANDLIVKELNSMTLEERETLFETVHGVADTVVETEAFVNNELEKIQKTINWIRKKEAYILAHFLSPEFVEDRELRLKALRVSSYNSVAAAKRIIQHFDFKLKLFGIDSLVKPITWDVLSPGMRESLRCGYMQLMPSKDRTNRDILFISMKDQPLLDWRSYYGMNMYLFDRSMRDIESQKKGFVFVNYMIGSSKPHENFNRVAGKTNEFESATLSHASVIHFCYDNPRLKPFLSLLQVLLEKRLRVRSTFGSHTECIYKLMSYGLTQSMLPLDENGNVDVVGGNRRLDEWIEQEREEAQYAPQNILPTGRCVVIGKGQGFSKFAGNRFLAELAERNRTRYAVLERLEKTKYSKAMVQYIETVRGGRFLKRTPVDELGKWEWILATDKEANDKVAQIFRKPSRSDVVILHSSEEYQLEDGRVILVPPQARLDEWEKIYLPD